MNVPGYVLVVAPTARELGRLQPSHAGSVRAALTGTGHGAGAALAALLTRDRPTVTVSLGFAGALNREAGTGDIAVCTEVRASGLPTLVLDGGLADAAMRALSAAHVGHERAALLTVPAPLLTSREKWAARAATGADVVDMEGYALAAAAAQAGVPLLALRTVVDEAHVDLPAFVGTIAADGAREWQHMLGALLRDPRLLATVPGLALRARRAGRALGLALAAVLPHLVAAAVPSPAAKPDGDGRPPT